MKDKRIIVFEFQYGVGEYNKEVEEIEVDENTTEKEIAEMYEEWVWETVGDYCRWYEKK